MSSNKPIRLSSIRSTRAILALAVIAHVALSISGLDWGLPTKAHDHLLFGGRESWSGEKIARLAGESSRVGESRGADVDVNPLDKSGDLPILLNATPARQAEIYRRYRLFTHQPDEMITMMSLSGMSPSEWDFDPRLYQYGGLFIYPVGVLIKACGVIGLIDVRSDQVYYLDNPNEFGKFYIVARAYAAGWGLIGVFVVFGIARRLGGDAAGALAGLLFVLMPVVISMAHEGKPHLPGAVLMLLAVYIAMRYVEAMKRATQVDRINSHAEGVGAHGKEPLPEAVTQGNDKESGFGHDCKYPDRNEGHCVGIAKSPHVWFWLTCVACGSAQAMVLSSLPIFILIPLIAFVRPKEDPERRLNGRHGTVLRWFIRTVCGVLGAGAIYLITNPYIVINAIWDPQTLQSNFGNSLAMYEIDRILEGLVCVVQLTVEGATLPMFVFGMFAFIVAFRRRRWIDWPLALPAAVLFVQFVLIGAGKPAEYGRFGVFTNAALAIGTACVLVGLEWRWRGAAVFLAALLVVWVGYNGARYITNLRADATSQGTRALLGEKIATQVAEGGFGSATIILFREPAPYGTPPMDFERFQVYYSPVGEIGRVDLDDYGGEFQLALEPVDVLPPPIENGGTRNDSESMGYPLSPISWANKPFETKPEITVKRRVTDSRSK